MRTRIAERGFTLLIAVILSAVASAVGLALASIAFKSVRLSDTMQGSNQAFYAADNGLECALYGDQQQVVFDYVSHATTPRISCAGPSAVGSVGFSVSSFGGSTLKFVSQSPSGYAAGWFPVASGCARVTVFKASSGATTVYSEGINTCNTADPRVVERGIYSFY